MTREEAMINVLVKENDELKSEISKLISTKEPCEDCISRQAVLDCLTASGLKKFDFILDARDKIKNLPPVTPKPKTGYWISHGEHCKQLGLLPSGLGSYWWCSKCDTGIDSIQFSRVGYNYCPNCGAKMEVE